MQTKTILFSAITLFLLIAGIGCEKEKEVANETIQIKDFSYFGCKEDETTKSTRAAESEEYIEYKAVVNGYLYLKHVNAEFNCCVDMILTEININGNEIRLTEKEVNPACRCICKYDLEYNLGPLSYEKYTLIFSRDTTEFLRFTINYNPSLYGKITVPKSVDLIGTWKLKGFGNEDTKAFKEAEPKDCDKCYTLKFNADGTLIGHTSTNNVWGKYIAEVSEKKIEIKDLAGTKINELFHGKEYVNALNQVNTYNLTENGNLQLFYEAQNKYLLFTGVKE